MSGPILCPSCSTVTTPGAVEWGRTNGYRPRTDGAPICHTCGNLVHSVSYTEGRGPSVGVSPKEKDKYDQQVLIRYKDGTRDPVKGISYKLIEHASKKALKEGETDEKGLTGRVTTEKPEAVDVIVLRLNDERQWVEKNIGSVRTDTRQDSIEAVEMYRGRIFFDFRYVNAVSDKPRSFIHAANTIRRKAQSYVDKYRGDVWWAFEITTECEMTSKWQVIYNLQQEADMEVQEGHILTHASKAVWPPGAKSGLEFAPREECNKDATLTMREILALPKLKWSSSSSLHLYGCRTGLPVYGWGDKTMGHAFFEGQDTVKTVTALKGYGYFSYSATTYQVISDDPNDKRDIYLLAYNRRKNVDLTNVGKIWIGMKLEHDNIEELESGDGSLIAPLILRR